MDVGAEKRTRKPGGPRAIPKEYEQVVIDMYHQGYGYRAIARRLREPEYDLNPDFSSVRRLLIRLGIVKAKSDKTSE